MADHKSQHTLPKMLIKNFTFDGKRCYTLNMKGDIHTQHINTISTVDYYYEIKSLYNKISTKSWMEKNYLGNTERIVSQMLSKSWSTLDSLPPNTDLKNLDIPIKREMLIWFIAQTINRVKFSIELASRLPSIQGNQSHDKALMLTMINSLVMANIMKNNVIILHRNNTRYPYITSIMGYSAKYIPKTHFVFTYFPLSSRYLIVLAPKISKEQCDFLVQDNEEQAKKFIGEMSHAIENNLFISSSKKSLELLQKNIIKTKDDVIDIPSSNKIEQYIKNKDNTFIINEYINQSLQELAKENHIIYAKSVKK